MNIVFCYNPPRVSLFQTKKESKREFAGALKSRGFKKVANFRELKSATTPVEREKGGGGAMLALWNFAVDLGAKLLI